MKYTVTGADKTSGQDTHLTLAAATPQEAERIAVQRGILVASIKPAKEEMEDGPIALWDEDPTHPVQTTPALPTNLLGNGPAANQAAPSAVIAQAPQNANYHVIQNPALYLLESAVNKHIKEGWEPLGGIQVSNWNNQLQYFQAMTKKTEGQ